MKPEIITSPGQTPYTEALAAMEQRAEAIRTDTAPELLWFLEHPPLYTSGTSAKPADLSNPDHFPVFEAGRGGQWTYHGPGQRIVYVMLDLKQRDMMDLRRYVQMLEQWIIATLARFDVEGFTREGRIGVWVSCSPLGGEPKSKSEARSDSVGGKIIPPTAQTSSLQESSSPAPPQGGSKEMKIAALGIRVRRWVTFHGIALNVHPDLSHYQGIVPCGIREHGVTSLHDLGITASMENVDAVLKEEFHNIFGFSLGRAGCEGNGARSD